MVHDFKKFPELTNAQMDLYYWQSPHKQITEDFTALVTAVHDGDTIKLKASFRDFEFRLRFLNIAAKELSEIGGLTSKVWMERRLLGKQVDIKINNFNRVDKWGRLLGYVHCDGQDVGEESQRIGINTSWENRAEGMIIPPKFEELKAWA